MAEDESDREIEELKQRVRQLEQDLGATSAQAAQNAEDVTALKAELRLLKDFLRELLPNG